MRRREREVKRESEMKGDRPSSKRYNGVSGICVGISLAIYENDMTLEVGVVGHPNDVILDVGLYCLISHFPSLNCYSTTS